MSSVTGTISLFVLQLLVEATGSIRLSGRIGEGITLDIGLSFSLTGGRISCLLLIALSLGRFSSLLKFNFFDHFFGLPLPGIMKIDVRKVLRTNKN